MRENNLLSVSCRFSCSCINAFFDTLGEVGETGKIAFTRHACVAALLHRYQCYMLVILLTRQQKDFSFIHGFVCLFIL